MAYEKIQDGGLGEVIAPSECFQVIIIIFFFFLLLFKYDAVLITMRAETG